jgi:hypothetical protein
MIICVALMLIVAGADAQDNKPAPPAEVSGGQTADFFPETYRLDRHEKTWEVSPFSREVLPPPPPEVKQGPDPWEGWKLSAIDRFGGQYTVGLTDKKNKFHVLKVGEENDDGIMITKVESNGRLKDTVIHLAEGSRSGTIEFVSSRLSMASKGAPVPKAAPKKAPSRSVARPHGMTKEQAAALLKKRAEAQKTIRDHMIKAGSKKSEPPKRRSVVLPPK